jgi:hypothetical protein
MDIAVAFLFMFVGVTQIYQNNEISEIADIMIYLLSFQQNISYLIEHRLMSTLADTGINITISLGDDDDGNISSRELDDSIMHRMHEITLCMINANKQISIAQMQVSSSMQNWSIHSVCDEFLNAQLHIDAIVEIFASIDNTNDILEATIEQAEDREITAMVQYHLLYFRILQRHFYAIKEIFDATYTQVLNISENYV